MTSSDVIFTGNITFDSNRATNGGALRFCDSSAMFLNLNTTVLFQNNYAHQVEGAIFAQEACLSQPKACFFQPVAKYNTQTTALSTEYNIILISINNTAGVAGDAIYGGEIDECYTYTKFRSSSGNTSYFLSSEVFNATFTFDDEGKKAISSEPNRVELCENSTDFSNGIIPGRRFTISVVAVGQRFGIAPAIITAELADSHSNITLTQIIHPTPTRECANISFILQTTQVGTTFEFMLQVQRNSPQPRKQNKKNITAFIKPCPWGFILSADTHSCECLAPMSITMPVTFTH